MEDEFEAGRVVISKAGRDKGRALVIVGVSGGRALVCDGRERPLSRPKSKNPVHLCLTDEYLTDKDLAGNRALRKALRQYKEGDEEDV